MWSATLIFALFSYINLSNTYKVLSLITMYAIGLLLIQASFENGKKELSEKQTVHKKVRPED